MEQRNELTVTKDLLVQKINEQLEPEETVLWAEEIVPNRKEANIFRLVALAGCVLIILLALLAFVAYGASQNIVSILVEVTLSLFAIRMALPLLGPLRMPTRVAVLTNMRALEVDRRNVTTVIWYSSEKFGNVEAIQTDIGVGNLMFALDEDNMRLGFRGVPNTAAAVQILFKVQDKKRGH